MPVVNPVTRLPMLRPVSIFRGLNKSALFEVARKAKEVSYPAGTTVVRQGEPGNALCIVVEGNLEVLRDDNVVAQLTAGDYFGELSLIDGQPRSATVVAVGEVALLTLKAEDFNALLEVPYVQKGVMLNLARLVREAHAGSTTPDEG